MRAIIRTITRSTRPHSRSWFPKQLFSRTCEGSDFSSNSGLTANLCRVVPVSKRESAPQGRGQTSKLLPYRPKTQVRAVSRRVLSLSPPRIAMREYAINFSTPKIHCAHPTRLTASNEGGEAFCLLNYIIFYLLVHLFRGGALNLQRALSGWCRRMRIQVGKQKHITTSHMKRGAWERDAKFMRAIRGDVTGSCLFVSCFRDTWRGIGVEADKQSSQWFLGNFALLSSQSSR